MKHFLSEILAFSTNLFLFPLIVLSYTKTLNKIYNILPFYCKRSFQKKYSSWNFKKSFIWSLKLLNQKKIYLEIKTQRDWFNALAYMNYAPELCVIEDRIAAYLKPKSQYFDIGANNGHRSFRFLTDNFRVHLIEANPYLCNKLKVILKNNTLKNYEIKNIGISSKKTNMNFFIHKRNTMSSFVKPKNKENIKKKLKIECLTLDDYFSEVNIQEKINFIKIDVEGHEKDVVLGAIDTIKNYNNFFLIEITSKEDKRFILDQFFNTNYCIFGLNWGIKKICSEIHKSNLRSDKFMDYFFIKNIKENKKLIESINNL